MIFGGCPPEFGVGVPLGVMPDGEALMIATEVVVTREQLSKGGRSAQETQPRVYEARSVADRHSDSSVDVVQCRCCGRRVSGNRRAAKLYRGRSIRSKATEMA